MKIVEQICLSDQPTGISDAELAVVLAASIKRDNAGKRERVLLIPPDCTRMHSGAGRITNLYYHMLRSWCDVRIMPALGTHVAMTAAESADMFGDIPEDVFLAHDWRNDVVRIGTVPQAYVEEISDHLLCEPIDIEINRALLDPSYDCILSIGQVVPHEVVGMANYSKNVLVGCGGSRIINASHILGAFYGLERIMGRDHSPVRKLFDYAEQHFLKRIPLHYILTVTTAQEEDVALHGLFIGRSRSHFEQAVALSQEKNLIFIDQPLRKVVVRLDAGEFKSTWLGNKAIYRTRMAIADGGELVILAPGVERFGEDQTIDELIRRFGYKGREATIACCRTHPDLQQNLSAAAHLIHGSSDGRFTTTYCTTHLSEQEIRSVGFDYMPYEQALRQYKPHTLQDGFNVLPNGEEIYYISNPALGLWTDRSRFESDV